MLVYQHESTADRSTAELGILNAKAAQAPWTVEGVVATIPGGPPQTDSSSPVPFFHMLERLKTTKREGWRRFGIKQWVSVPSFAPRAFVDNVSAAANR